MVDDIILAAVSVSLALTVVLVISFYLANRTNVRHNKFLSSLVEDKDNRIAAFEEESKKMWRLIDSMSEIDVTKWRKVFDVSTMTAEGLVEAFNEWVESEDVKAINICVKDGRLVSKLTLVDIHKYVDYLCIQHVVNQTYFAHLLSKNEYDRLMMQDAVKAAKARVQDWPEWKRKGELGHNNQN